MLAHAPVLKKNGSPDAALRDIVLACLDQILPNAAEAAAERGSPEHLHQARIGLRRLSSALRLFGDWSDAVQADWLPRTSDLVARLGNTRDRDVLAGSILPELQAAGAPFADLPCDERGEAASDILRHPGCAQLWLELIAFAHEVQRHAPSTTAAHASKLTMLIDPRIGHLHRQLERDAAAYLTLDDALRHRARKRLKRLRYCIELVASLYRSKEVSHYLNQLRPAQDALGEYNDLCVATTLFERMVERDARAWFALGWLAARRASSADCAAHALQTFVRVPPFW